MEVFQYHFCTKAGWLHIWQKCMHLVLLFEILNPFSMVHFEILLDFSFLGSLTNKQGPEQSCSSLKEFQVTFIIINRTFITIKTNFDFRVFSFLWMGEKILRLELASCFLFWFNKPDTGELPFIVANSSEGNAKKMGLSSIVKKWLPNLTKAIDRDARKEENTCLVFELILLQIADIHIYHPLRSGRIWHKVNFLSEV